MNEKNKYDEAAREQIEEMAKEMCKCCRESVTNNTCVDVLCTGVLQHAEALYNTGYHKQEWISVEERLPEAEKEVLIFAIRRYKGYGRIQEVPIITTAIYEDGLVSNEDSVWNWYDIDFIYDEENDIEYIPEGWWEYRHYNPDDIYNNMVDDTVTHWMPLPEAPKMKGGAE